MNRKIIVFLIFIFGISWSQAQTNLYIKGVIKDAQNEKVLQNAEIFLEGNSNKVLSNHKGEFYLTDNGSGSYILQISIKDYVSKRIPVFLEGKDLELGVILIEKDITLEKSLHLINISEDELLDDEMNSNSLALLQATKDVFLNRAAFDFGQAFFRVRGYDSQYGEVRLNGLPMNKLLDGRPQWNNWGGLNDVIRNQLYANGLEVSDFTFGSILGNTNIDLRPSRLRPGTRLSSSISNRTYSGRLMATYNSGLKNEKFAFMLSASRRWAKEGYIDGTLYDAYSLYGNLEYQFNKKHTLNFAGILGSNRRGRSSALTEEVFEIQGRKYNPYWGKQNGKIRNSRERHIKEPLFLLNYIFESNRVKVDAGLSYQTGFYKRSRLGYYNAPNPDPTYYRYLPSFYINSPIGANFESAIIAKDGFLKNPELNWGSFYKANTSLGQNGKAAYVLYDDTIADDQLTLNLNSNINLSDSIRIDFGTTFQELHSKNYALINDLLGAEYHNDIDIFSETRNDLATDVNKKKGDIFNYHYKLLGNSNSAYTQLNLRLHKLSWFISGKYELVKYQRSGLYQNERFLNNSLGKSERVKFSNWSLKSGVNYKVTGRHWVSGNIGLIQKAPILQNVFVNPRESNTVVPNINNEKITTVDATYFLRLPKLTGRLTGYYTRFQNTTDINFFFVDSGIGSDFVQEVLTDMDKLHMGTELGLEYQLSSAVKLSFVSSIAKHIYASDPSVTINFDTAGSNEDVIDVTGSKSLGIAAIKGYKLAQGPQKAIAIGLEYRDPKYWWVGTTANYLANNYANISTIIRTESFLTDPETGEKFPEATTQNVQNLLKQRPLDNFYLLNLIGGKSWLRNGKYLSVFASVNNVFDTTFRTGGYEQSRNGNYGQLNQDNLSGTPSFAPKYWYGFGRTYFLNLAFSF
ncbi:carboxypeptidase-like regulatory domain-containing protein [Maribacter sp. MAR_2009_72]|uniref:carboxypeptidase-like regulatory domain-containing protein n=1 Tax=Maribacter sp. MAR_2009_72 TaxID=1250050 RepID=UPI00119900CA|nr:carboxypeptidase-like regulatory domain-containing protein [Maribacter sp. MAR_2009_72]TVZ15867.1 outer membrane receptor protein involved in Fe transport [Maribacter sp. MAR_2009_72]